MFRFSIRDVFWLMTVVGIVFGWRNDHNRLLQENYLARGTYDRLHAALWQGRATAAAHALKSFGHPSTWLKDGVKVQFSPSGGRGGLFFRSDGRIDDPESDRLITIYSLKDAMRSQNASLPND